jgi:FkbM family methyltransferase
MQISIDAGEQWLIDEQRQRLAEYDGPLDCIIDVGAHVGTFALAAADRGAKLVIAIEPDPQNYLKLCQNITGNRLNHIIVPLPLAATVRGWQDVILRRAGVNSGQRSVAFKDTFPGVHVRSLDFWNFSWNSGHRIDYLKIDIEGGEWELLSDQRARSILSYVGYVNIEGHPLDNERFFNGWKPETREQVYNMLCGLFDIVDYGPPQAPVWRGPRKMKKR